MEERGEPAEISPDQDNTFKVTCGALTGTLYKSRFGSGNHASLQNQKHYMFN